MNSSKTWTVWNILPRKLFDAIRSVETGGHPDPENAEGADGELGPYQITEQYWIDALEHRPELGGTYDMVRNQYYAEWVMMAYWDRWATSYTFEVLARQHNGGPWGHTSVATNKYWKLIKERLDASDDIRH